MLDAVRAAIFDDENRPSILSISFGFPEHLWTPVALTILDELFTAAALLGVSVFCAAGDNGAELDAEGNAARAVRLRRARSRTHAAARSCSPAPERHGDCMAENGRRF